MAKTKEKKPKYFHIRRDEHNAMYLAKPIHKGILRLVFSRFALVVLLILMQLALVGALIIAGRQYIPHFTILQTVYAAFVILYLFTNNMDSSVKLTWMAIIAIMPIPGTLFLAFTQTNLGNRTVKQLSALMIDRTRDAIDQDPRVMEELTRDHNGMDDLHRYINRSGCMPIFDSTEVTYFPTGQDMFEALLPELEKAEKFIFIESFIIEEGYMWGRVLDVLARKAAEGVEVRVMYDGMCEISNLPIDYPKRLAAVGINAKTFSALRPVVSTHYNYRDHRKVLVIDNKVAFNGGVNMADEYINRKERFGVWKDTAVMLKGPAAKSFTLMFLQMWNVEDPDMDFSAVDVEDKEINLQDPSDLSAEDLTEDPASLPTGYVMPYGDCPLDDDKVGESVYMDVLYRADSYVHIMTPYLILDGEMQKAICYAAERGIDVKIILPGIPDKKTAYSLAKSHYLKLLRSGVKLYEFTPGFVHAKVFVSDDSRATVGTINLDYRSLYHHFECATYLYKCDAVEDVEKDFQETLAQCREMTLENYRKGNIPYLLLGAVLKIVAPLL